MSQFTKRDELLAQSIVEEFRTGTVHEKDENSWLAMKIAKALSDERERCAQVMEAAGKHYADPKRTQACRFAARVVRGESSINNG